MISVTALSAYLYCPRKLFLERALKLTEPPKGAIVKGNIRHKTYEKINFEEKKLILSITESDTPQEIHKKYLKSYTTILKSVVISHKFQLKQVGLPLLETYQNIRDFLIKHATSRAITIEKFKAETSLAGEKLWQALTPKIKSEVRLESQSLGLRGIIDQIEIYEDKKIPVELKTGKSPDTGMWPGHKIQLAAYILLLQEHLKQPVKMGILRYLDSDKEQELSINPALRDEVLDLTKKVNLLLTSKTIPEHCQNKNKCKGCGVKKHCYDEGFMKLKVSELFNRNI